MTPPDVLTLAELDRLVGGGADPDAVGEAFGVPLVVVDVTEGDAAGLAVLRDLPVVVVAVGEEAEHASADVAVEDGGSGPFGSASDVLAALAGAVAASPHAAVMLVQLLRLQRGLGVADAIVAESMAYGLLQAGPEHRRWLEAQPVRTHRHADEPVRLHRDAGRLRITLARPDARNAYDAATRLALVEAFRLAAADPSIDAVVVDGDGPTFSAGGDLAEFGSVEHPVRAHLIRTSHNAGRELAAVADRVECRVHGPCVGAGVELPAFAGRVVAERDTTFRLPEVAMGLVPGAGGTVSVARRCGRQRAALLALSGIPLDVPTALAWGLVDEVT